MRRKRVEFSIVASAVALRAPLPPLQPYVRCTCGSCRECEENAKWDRVFAKFEVKDATDQRGFYRSPISDL
jgi:hypothetical protein